MAAFDEMADGRSGVRPHWREALAAVASLGAAELLERAEGLARLAEEEGAAVAGEGRPGWVCDPLPLPLSAAEFATLADGLAQRARLLEALLADLHGPQQVLASGALPSALVFANPGFERACCGLPGPFLHAYAADLVRGPDGRWRVLADRLGGVTGAGYAAEIRELLARVLPEVVRPSEVEPIRPFFEAWQETLTRPAPGLAPGFAAILAPGAADPHWAGHLALARALGCALVEPRDLTVRGGAVMLETLRGLRRVDVLLRRVPSRDLDSLEMPRGSDVGVPGLLDAIRGGAVRVVNGPGTELVEAPALAAFLPALCRSLLGEPLRLAAVPTLWLADDPARATVRQSLRRWAIRPAMGDAVPIVLHDLPPERRAALDAAIAARPWEWAASALVEPSTAPCATAEGLQPRPVVLRLFLICDGVAWRALPGGVARLLRAGEWATEAMPARAVVKDVAVLRGQGDEAARVAQARRAPLVLRRATGEFPSRVADDFYGLGISLERLEGQARLGRAALARAGRGAALPRDIAETALLAFCLDGAGVPMADGITEGLRAALSPGGALAEGMNAAEWLLDRLRDRLTGEMHGALRQALRASRADSLAASTGGADAIARALATAARVSLLASGIAAEGMVRAGGWRFLDLGRRMERAQLGAAVLAQVLDQPAARIESALGLALELGDVLVTYQARYGASVQPGAVLDLLVADADNPRSLAFQFVRAAALLSTLERGTEAAAHAERLRVRAEGIVASVRDEADQAGAASRLVVPLRAVKAGASALSDEVRRCFLTPPLRPRIVGLELA